MNRLWAILTNSRQGVRDTVVSTIPQIVGVFTGLVSSILVARGLGPDGMGQYALVMSIAGIATSLSDLGIGQTAIRYASRAAAMNDTSTHMALLRWALRWRLSLVFLSTTIFYLLTPQIAKLWNSSALVPYMRISLAGGVFAALVSIPTIYFQSIKRFSINASITSAQKLISFAGILIISVFGLWSLRNLVLANLFASGIASIIFIAIVPRAVLLPKEIFSKLRKLKLRQWFSSPMMNAREVNSFDSSTPTSFLKYHILSTVFVMLTMRADVWMMGYYLDKSELGIYSVATRFTLPLTILMGGVSTALWPRASGVDEPKRLISLLMKTLRLSGLVALFLSLYAIFAPTFAPTIFGENYVESIILGQVLSFRYCLAILISPIGIVGYSFGLVRVSWIINLIQLVAVIIINAIFLPRIGSLASAIALLVNTSIGAALTIVLILYKRRNIAWS